MSHEFGQSDYHAAELSSEDQQVLDRLIEAGFDVDAVEAATPAERQRIRAVASVFGLLEDYPVEDASELLVDVTLARVARQRSIERGVIARIDADAEDQSRRRIRLPDFVSIAAVLLIVAGVGWPIMGAIRQKSIDNNCVANLSAVGSALSRYAGDWDQRVPIMAAGFTGVPARSSWVDTDLVSRLGYCSKGHLDCPGHYSGGGYSRQVLAGVPDGMSWLGATSGRALLGDRNPMVDAWRKSSLLPPSSANSESHRGKGQNVLFGDGSVRWLEMPVTDSDDNIWLPRGATQYRPGAVPAGDDDVLLSQ